MKTKIKTEKTFIILLSVTTLAMMLTLIESRINRHPTNNYAICNYATPGPGQLCMTPSQINLTGLFH